MGSKHRRFWPEFSAGEEHTMAEAVDRAKERKRRGKRKDIQGFERGLGEVLVAGHQEWSFS